MKSHLLVLAALLSVGCQTASERSNSTDADIVTGVVAVWDESKTNTVLLALTVANAKPREILIKLGVPSINYSTVERYRFSNAQSSIGGSGSIQNSSEVISLMPGERAILFHETEIWSYSGGSLELKIHLDTSYTELQERQCDHFEFNERLILPPPDQQILPGFKSIKPPGYVPRDRWFKEHLYEIEELKI